MKAFIMCRSDRAFPDRADANIEIETIISIRESCSEHGSRRLSGGSDVDFFECESVVTICTSYTSAALRRTVSFQQLRYTDDPFLSGLIFGAYSLVGWVGSVESGMTDSGIVDYATVVLEVDCGTLHFRTRGLI